MQKAALITGGSSGIGFAIANELAKRGYSLVLVSNQQDSLERCKRVIEAKHAVSCNIFNADLTKENAAQEVFDYTRSQNLEIEILVNNAGILVFSETVEASTEEIHAILQLHVNVPTMLCRLYGNEMKKRNCGHILNVASISAVMPYPGISIYGPSKTYMRYFSRALRSEMKIYRVNVTCLIPGATSTSLYDPDKVNLQRALRLGAMKLPEYVARKAVKAMFRKKAECIPGCLNKIIVCLMPLIPMRLIFLIHKHTNMVQKGNASLR